MSGVLHLELDGDGCWPDLAAKNLIHLQQPTSSMALLKDGMQSGKPSVALRIDLPGGKVLVAEYSLDMLETAVRALRAATEG